jgi:iron complex transport system permease protein
MNITRFKFDLIIVLVSIVILVFAPFIGVYDLSLKSIFDYSSESASLYVFWNLRVPRVLAGFLIGAVLSSCGVVFQALFHNPLASPFTLGVSSGAALGAAIGIVFGISASFLSIPAYTLFALVGALLTIILVYHAGRDTFGLSNVGMLLVGVIINFFFGSLVVFLQYLADLTQLFSLMRWLMGSLEILGIQSILPLVR